MRLLLVAVLSCCFLGCGGNEKINMPTHQNKISTEAVKNSGWGAPKEPGAEGK